MVSDKFFLWKRGTLFWNAGQDHNQSQPLVTTYTIGRLQLAPSATQRVVLYVRPKSHGLLTVHGLGFDVRLSKTDAALPPPSSSSSSGVGPGVSGRVAFRVAGPRLNSTPAERQGCVYAADKRLQVHVGPAMPKVRPFQPAPT